MKRNLTLLFLLLLLFETGTAQVIRYRLSTNSGMFLSEVGKKEIAPPEVTSHPESRNFTPSFKPGVELEVIAPFSRTFEMGIQFGYNNYAGYTPSAPLYNFFLSRYNPMREIKPYPHEALVYDTHILKIMGTARWYFYSFNRDLNFFMNYFGGAAFTGTDFTFHDPVNSVQIYKVGVLYARGTKSSDLPKAFGLTGGAGLGATYRLSDRFDVYFDATASVIHSDLVNGVPNYNYVAGDTPRMEPTNALAATLQASIGVIYSAIPDKRMNKNNITRSSSLNRNNFVKRKAKSTFNKRKRR